MTFRTLDVACGGNPRGDVNVDRFVFDSPHTKSFINPYVIQNFVVAHCENLPFQGKTFQKVTCFHGLEHFCNPFKALNEMRRVCNGTIMLETPSEFCIGSRDTHLYTWNPRSLEHLLKKVFVVVHVSYSRGDLLGRSRLKRFVPFLAVVLSKMGFHPTLIAVCKRSDFG